MKHTKQRIFALWITLFMWGTVPAVLAQSSRFIKSPESRSTALTVMSYNIHHGADKKETLTLEDIGAFINASGADLIGLQEVDSMCRRSGQEDQMKQLAEITGMHYAFKRHFAYDGGAYGLGLLSRFPISDIRGDRITSTSSDGTPKTLVLLSAKVELPGGKKVRMSTVHLALDQPTRMKQAEETLDYLQGDIPVILTGDMNAKPDNPVIRLFESRFTKLDQQLQPTFPAGAPDRKIDFIFVTSSAIESVNQVIVPQVLHSDHLPLISSFRIR